MVGVVPPPFHGQSILTRALFDADLEGVDKWIVEVRSSTKITEVGKPGIGKLFGTFRVILRILRQRFRSRSRVFYYTAGSGAMVPFVRDLLILGTCRPFFRRTVIHYHSGNLLDFIRGSAWKRGLGCWIYGRGAWSIRLGEGCPVPGPEEGVARVVDLPNGIRIPEQLPQRRPSERFRVLFLGNLFVEKGVLVVIEAVRQLALRVPVPLSLHLVGEYPDPETRTRVAEALAKLPADVAVPPPGPAHGEEKWAALRDADVLVFPSTYRRENLPLVIIEAMIAELPVVATRWRGIPSLVRDGETGFLVETPSPGEIGNQLERLATEEGLAETLGRNAAGMARESFGFDTHLGKMAAILQAAGRD